MSRAERFKSLKELREARQLGVKRDYQLEKEKQVYDVVDDDDYKSIVRGRQLEDDFIEDDDGSGYVDHGLEDWDRSSNDEDGHEQEERSDSDDDQAQLNAKRERREERRKARQARAARASKAYRPSSAAAAGPNVLMGDSAKPAQGANPYIKQVAVEKEDDFMNTLLSDLGDTGSPSTTGAAPTQTRAVQPPPPAVRAARPPAPNYRKRRSDVGTSASAVPSPLGRSVSSTSTSADGAAKRARFEEDPAFGAGVGGDTAMYAHNDSASARAHGDHDPGFDEALMAKDSWDDYNDPVAVADVDANRDDHEVNDADVAVKAPTVAKKKVPGTRRQLVNSSKPMAEVKQEEVPLDKTQLDALAKSEKSNSNRRARGLDWRLATANLAPVRDEEQAALGLDNDSSVNDDNDNGGLPKLSFQSKAAAARGVQLPNAEIDAGDDGKVHMYWLDSFESNGTLFFLGKVRAKSTSPTAKPSFVSACIAVGGINRRLFFLPRTRQVDTDGIEMDDMPVEQEDLEDEVNTLLTDREDEGGLAIPEDVIQTRWVHKKYAFEKKAVAREADYLEVCYPAVLKRKSADKRREISQVSPRLDIDRNGTMFSHVFGANTSLFELVVIDRKVMGPCWLEIQGIKPVTENRKSWCKFEGAIESPDDLRPCTDGEAGAPREPPPLTMMSLSARTVVHLERNVQEVVAVSVRTWQNVALDDVTVPIEQKPSTLRTIIRPLFTPFPAGFPLKVPRQSVVSPMGNEKLLLQNLLATIAREDPDVVVGHDFGVTLGVILQRMKEERVENWSRIGRLIRPVYQPTTFGNKSNAGSYMAGRLICDLSSEAQRAIIESTTWSLTEMCATHLNIEREEIDPDETAKYFDNTHSTAGKLMDFVRHTEGDAIFQMLIASRVQALLLSRQLTNLAGTNWNATLSGNRAERNEFILLHEFNKLGYICPDKLTFKDRERRDKERQLAQVRKNRKAGAGQAMSDAEEEEEDEDEDAKPKNASKKSKKGKGKKVKTDDGDDFDRELEDDMQADEEATIKNASMVGGKKAKFIGGLVFDPKRGLWDRYILVMDFNSLYPSIIQQYDIDFTTIEWSEEEDEDLENMPALVATREPTGVLPKLIGSLVERRRAVKSLMKDKNDPKYQQYDIRQKALKLTANSMYGCLGYERSRFYARPLAALVTYKGRETLTKTREEAEKINLNVIYGDTDSVMINTNEVDYQAAMKIGADFKAKINAMHTLLEIDTDAVFSRMLLLQKKKYAAVKVEERETAKGVIERVEVKEIKGLDMKRREYSELSKEASKAVLDSILSGEPTEEVVANILGYLSELAVEVRAGQKTLEDFLIFKRLGGDPSSYKDAKSLPHVLVAQRMLARGQSARSGDVVPYVFCASETEKKAQKSGKADQAYHPEELRRQGSELKVDFEYYLSSQILPPIQRLCEHIEGADKSRLAECLGLDASRYRNADDVPEREFTSLQSQISDAERFRDAAPLSLKCTDPTCDKPVEFKGMQDQVVEVLTPTGLQCGCQRRIPVVSAAIQLENQIRAHISRFYEGWLVCDDQSCGTRTRMMSVYGRRCLSQSCRGQMRFEFSDLKLHDQLLFLRTIFDSEKALRAAADTLQSDNVRAIVANNESLLRTLRATVDKYLDKNGRRWVSMTSLFSFMAVGS